VSRSYIGDERGGRVEPSAIDGGKHLLEVGREAGRGEAPPRERIGRRGRGRELASDLGELARGQVERRRRYRRAQRPGRGGDVGDRVASWRDAGFHRLDGAGRGNEVGTRRVRAADDGSGSRARRLQPGRERRVQLGEHAFRDRHALSDEAVGQELGARIGKARTEDEGHAQDGTGAGERRARAYHGRMVSTDALRPLPKAELHQHLDGSIRPTTAVELAEAIGLPLTLEEAQRRMVGPERCADQAELLGFFDLPIALLQTREALERGTCELIEDLMRDGVRYAEIRWAPRLHLERGMSVRDVIDAVASGIARAALAHGPATPLVGLIVTAMRSHPPAANVELAHAAAEVGAPVIGFDLAGPEVAWPAPPHAAAFNAARDGGLSLTAHAGEVPGAQRVREVLDLGVRRVAHGVTAVEDEALLQLLRARDVTLDLCPTSNVQAGIAADLSSHPIAALHRAGVSVTLSTDDRTVTGTTLSDEMARTAEATGMTAEELASIALNGFRRGFAQPVVMAPIIAAAARAWDAWRSEPNIT